MYTRRKVFSVANDYDYSDYYERLYSEAFEDGVDFAEKMFAEEEKKGFFETLKGLPTKAKEKIINQWGKYAKKEGEGINWKNIGNRSAMIAAPVAALAGLGYGGYKLATRKKEKEYSEGFEDGYDFAIQKMFAIKLSRDEYSRLKAMTSELTDAEKEIMDKGGQKFVRGLSKEDAIKKILGQRKDKGASLKEYEEFGFGGKEAGDVRKQRAEAANSHVDPLAGKSSHAVDPLTGKVTKGSVEARIGKGLTNKEQKAIQRMKENSNNGNWRANVYKENAEKIKGLESDVKGLTKNLKRWKIGAGVAGGLGALGAGYGLYNGLRSND